MASYQILCCHQRYTGLTLCTKFKNMLLPLSGGNSSYQYIGEDLKAKIRSEIDQVNPFSIRREKREFFQQVKGSV